MKRNLLTPLFPLLLAFLFVNSAAAQNQVYVDFLFWDPSTSPVYCPTCPSWVAAYESFLEKNDTLTAIQGTYGEVSFEWIEYYSDEGQAKAQLFSLAAPNPAVISLGENNFTVVEGDFDEAYIRATIDAYLEYSSPPPPPQLPLVVLVLTAFSLGVLETFSPCLIALLSFILSFTIGRSTDFKENMSQVLAFGIGFVFSAVLLGLIIGMVFLSNPSFQHILMWVTSLGAILLGLNLLGVLKLPFDTKPLISTLARKHVLTYAGLFSLGIVFYFLDPCIAPVFFAMLPLLAHTQFLLVLLTFSVGMLLPFIALGFVAGSISKLARTTYRHKSKIRALSGLILIGYSIYIIFVVLNPALVYL
jgi:cytochrome c biogenesis protein CcdA